MSAEYRSFTLERAFDACEFKPGMRQLSCSDGEPLAQTDLLALADSECQQLWNNLTLSYTQVGGHPLLIKELISMYRGRDVPQILPVVPQEGILLAMMALCDQIMADSSNVKDSENFEAIVAWPSYQSLHETLRSRGATLKLWKLKAESDTEWTFDLDDLKALIGSRTRLVVVNFPHNPSGFAPSPESWAELICLCRDNGIYLFSDEIYNACARRSGQQSSHQSLAIEPAANLYDKAVSMSGLSKCFGLPGLRLGWLVCQNEQLMSRMRLLKDYTTICLPGPVEILGLVALRNSVQLVDRIREIVAENLQLAKAFFGKHERLFVWREPLAGTTALVEMLDPLLNKFDGNGAAFCAIMIDRFNVFIVGSELFEFSNRYFRLGLGRRDLGEVLTCMETALRDLGLI